MNLNYPYNKASLKALTLTADKKLDIHTLVVDYDGEVVLDPEIHFPSVALSKFKFCTQVREEDLRDNVQLASLYDALDEIFHNPVFGEQKYIGDEMAKKIAA